MPRHMDPEAGRLMLHLKNHAFAFCPHLQSACSCVSVQQFAASAECYPPLVAHLETSAVGVEVAASAECRPPLVAHPETSAMGVEAEASAECRPPLVAHPVTSAAGVEVVLMDLLPVAVAAEVDPSAR